MSTSALHNPIMEAGDKDIHAIQDKVSKEKERCMVYFRLLHSHLMVLSDKYLNGTRTGDGFKRAFMTLFSQDVQTFTSIVFLNMDQLEKQLNKEEIPRDWINGCFQNTVT
ncbi:hypothetical protein Tco_0341503 [Tanacetum coccineum]